MLAITSQRICLLFYLAATSVSTAMSSLRYTMMALHRPLVAALLLTVLTFKKIDKAVDRPKLNSANKAKQLSNNNQCDCREAEQR